MTECKDLSQQYCFFFNLSFIDKSCCSAEEVTNSVLG